MQKMRPEKQNIDFSKGPIGALTSGAKNLVDNFSKYK